jgi:deazaflavin-dependent oxidoreductase (nitroreductase family)
MMAKTYQVGHGTRLINRIFGVMTRLGAGASCRRVLTVRGRKTGRLHSTPVDVMEYAGSSWLVAPYGPVNWVRNALAAGEVTLSRGGHSQRFTAVAAGAGEATPVLRKYITEIRVTRPYFDAEPDAADDAITAELAGHPVLRLTLAG